MNCRTRLSRFWLITAMFFCAVAGLQAQSNVTVFATGLNNPRGLKFGPDGFLYVAEGGAGGSASTVGLCEQVVRPLGPYTGGFTARISKIDPNGTRTTVVDNLPSNQTSPDQGSLVSGVADVAFIDKTLYAILAGGGWSPRAGGAGKRGVFGGGK